MTLPSVLLVPGAWHKPDHFRPLIDELADVDVHTVTLTSSGDDPATLRDMHSDAEAIARAVEAIDRPVVVVAHSYGGLPATRDYKPRNARHLPFSRRPDGRRRLLLFKDPEVYCCRGHSCANGRESTTSSRP